VASPYGLCADCRFCKTIRSDRGATFLQCEKSFTDPRFPKYPRLPVLACTGYEPNPPRAIISAPMAILDINEIRGILPHRYPFLLVDRIVELEADRIVGIKNVTANEPHFTGHFPDFPVMPGVLIIEAMAQTAGVLVLKSMPDRENKLVLLVAIENARFRRPVVPGDTLRMEMRIIRRKASVAKMAGIATVDGNVVAEAEVMCKLAGKEEKAAPAPPPVEALTS
jgi:3-hydroxyacyl-[acyl-carrier-protein] dehydratase